ncbi:MAG: helix-turn-helix transcriptional regulator [Spirochaetaceae bacterium]
MSEQLSVDDTLSIFTDRILNLVDADRGAALFKIVNGLPVCIRWPEYSEPRVREFNTHFNRQIPIFKEASVLDFGPIRWERYRETEYVADFMHPIGVRTSSGGALVDRFSGERYVVWVNRNDRLQNFSDLEAHSIQLLCRYSERIVSLRSELDAMETSLITHPELGPEAEILSRRESEVARLLCRRLTMKEMSVILKLSPRTVERHALHIYQKLNVEGRRELTRLLTPPPPQTAPGFPAAAPPPCTDRCLEYRER